MRVCVLGGGSLSLGLLCPWLTKLSHVELSLITRAGLFADTLVGQRGYRLDGSPERFELDTVFPDGVHLYDPTDLTDERAAGCLAHLRDVDVAVVSVGVRNLPAAAALIARACMAAEDRRPLHLVAFENSPDASQRLHQQVESHRLSTVDSAVDGDGLRPIVAHRAIADRACSRALDDSEVLIRVERFSEIVLESTADKLFRVSPEHAPPQPQVRFVDPELVHLAEMRKFWLVNGTHTALGLLCYAADRQLLLDAVEEPAIRDFVQELHREWVRVLHQWAKTTGWSGEADDLFSERSLTAHASAILDRLRDLPEFSVLNVLSELAELGGGGPLAGRAMLRLIEKLDDRLGHQVRAAQEAARIAVPASAWMLASGLNTVRRHAEAYWLH